MMVQRMVTLTILILANLAVCSCGPGSPRLTIRRGFGPDPAPPPNTKVEIAIVNDTPLGTATVSICLCTTSQGSPPPCQQIQVPIGAEGTGTTGQRETFSTCTVFVSVLCASGVIHNALAVSPVGISAPGPKLTVNCQTVSFGSSDPGWLSFNNVNKAIHLDEGPDASPPFQYSSVSPYDEIEREGAARYFLSQNEANARQANVLYAWLWGTSPPDNTVLQNLNAGQSTESQIVYLVSSETFFADSGFDNGNFVFDAYGLLLDRGPTQWEYDAAVQDLDGYWVYEEQGCDENCFWFDGNYICDPAPPPPCGHWEWHQKSRWQFAWEMVSSFEFAQVSARYMYGVQMRREASANEITNQAYHIVWYGLKEGAVRLMKSWEYFQNSTNPW
jgi:hypothetical protein